MLHLFLHFKRYLGYVFKTANKKQASCKLCPITSYGKWYQGFNILVSGNILLKCNTDC